VSGAVRNTGTTMGAIASESASFDQLLRELPGALRNSNTTARQPSGVARRPRPADRRDQAVAPQLQPFFKRLRLLVRMASRPIHDLRLS